ncbi:hypothetical protein, partial [Proteus mirabilis]
RWLPLALLCAGVVVWIVFPRVGHLAATVTGGLFYALALIGALLGLLYILPAKGSPSARPYAFAVALGMLAVLASLAHPHSFARSIERIADTDD